MIGPLRNGGRVRRIIQHAAHSHVEVIRIGIEQEQVRDQALEETIRNVEQPDDVGLEGIDLVEEIAAQVTGIAEGCGNHRPFVFRTVLIAHTQGDVRMGQVGAPEEIVRKTDEPRNADRRCCAELGGPDVLLGLELEIAFESQVEELSPMKDILMEVVELRRDPEKSRGVHRGLQIRLEPLDTAALQGDVAVHDIVEDGSHRHVYAVEYAQIGKAGVGRIHDPGAVAHAGTEEIQAFQDAGTDFDVGRRGKGDIADGELPMRLCFVRGFAPGILQDGHRQVRRSVRPERIGFEQVIILVETVIAAVQEKLGGADRFIFQGRFGKILPGLDGRPAFVQFEVPFEFVGIGKLVLDRGNGVSMSGTDMIGHVGAPVLVFDLTPDGRSVPADVFHVVGHVVHAHLHLLRLENDRRRPDVPDEIVDPGIGRIGPVVDGNAGAPAENRPVGLLADIGRKVGGTDAFALHLDLAAGQAVFPGRNIPGRTAGGGQRSGKEKKQYGLSAVHSYKNNTFLRVFRQEMS